MAEGHVKISQRGADRVRSGHLWVYRSDVRSAEAESGATVRVTDEHDNFVGRAFSSSRSQITLRFLTREDVPVNTDFLRSRILAARRIGHREHRESCLPRHPASCICTFIRPIRSLRGR